MTQPSFQGAPVKEAGGPPAASVVAAFPPNITAAAVHRALQPARFPGEDGGKSLAQMAQSDLDAALQLLVDRAQYITGASGAAIALRSGKQMICRASAGTGAPAVGSQLQVSSGLTGESVRMRQILRCDDAEKDERVNRESCRALGISSVIVAPLLRGPEVIGVFELLSGRPSAFEERDIVALQRLGEMIQTAVEHAENAALPPGNALSNTPERDHEQQARQDAVQNAAPQAPEVALTAESGLASGAECGPVLSTAPVLTSGAPANPAPAVELPSPASSIRIAVSKCQACGFPISEGRKLCVDCEAAQNSGELPITEKAGDTEFLAHYGDPANSPNWFKANIYWIGMVLVSLATVAAIVYLR